MNDYLDICQVMTLIVIQIDQTLDFLLKYQVNIEIIDCGNHSNCIQMINFTLNQKKRNFWQLELQFKHCVCPLIDAALIWFFCAHARASTLKSALRLLVSLSIQSISLEYDRRMHCVTKIFAILLRSCFFW